MKRLFNGFIMSLSMFSTIPVFVNIWDDKAMCLIIPFMPLVGLIISSIWYAIAVIIYVLEIPVMLSAVIIALIPFFLSGFIHTDGYMDTCDAIFSRGTLEKKRNILKDSHVGAFAAIALVVLLLLNVSSIYSILDNGKNLIPIILIPVLARSISGLTLLNVKPISETGFGASFKKNSKTIHKMTLLFYILLCFILGFFIGKFNMIYILLALSIAGIWAAIYSTKQLEGISGDLCGFITTVGETAALICMACL